MAKREYEPYSKEVAGQRIVDAWRGSAVTGAQLETWWYRVECTCKDKILVTVCHSTITRALRGRALLRCVPCKRRLKSRDNKKRYQRPNSEPKRRGRPPVGDKAMTSVERANRHADKVKALKAAKSKPKKPMFDADTLTILKELAKKPSLMRRVMERARPYIAAALEAKMKPQTSQILTDALAMEKRGEKDDGWTADTRWEGLKLQSYDLSYHAPAI